jgi:hypothetical protein
MSRYKTLIIAGSLAFAALFEIENTTGQDAPSSPPKNAAKTASERKKLDWWRQRRASKARDSALKAHMKHQSKAVRKRMKKDAKKAKVTNDGGAY